MLDYGPYVSNALVLMGVLVAYTNLRRENKKEVIDQASRHQENISRLESLRQFQSAQGRFNELRDEELGQLKIQTSRITAILEGQNRRLEMLENRR